MHHTANPSFPHPDSDNPDAPTLDEAIRAAYELLNSKKEGPEMQHARRRAAFDLMDAYEFSKEQQQ
jgi:hypothetical protein